MKPIKLTIEGVNSFNEAQTLDFEAVGRNNLFCISGKTGAGKTTIFDSIMLALYGKSGKGDLADVVNLSRMTARVTFDFAANGDFYSVERAIKCRREKDGNGAVTEKRAASSECTLFKNGAPFAKGGEANELLKSIVGLEAGEFKNVYLLEQGEYAEFLKKPPAKQTEAVGKIFSLMRFGDVSKLAGERQREQERRADDTALRMGDLGDVSAEKLAAEKKALAVLRASTTTLVKDAQAMRERLDLLEKQRDAYISVREKQSAVRTLTLQFDDAKKAREESLRKLDEFERSADPNVAAKLAAARKELDALIALNALDKQYEIAVADAKDKASARADKAEQAEKANAEYKVLAENKARDDRAVADAIAKFVECSALLCDRSDALNSAVATLSGENAGLRDLSDARHALDTEKRDYDNLVASRDKQAKQLEDKRKACDELLDVIAKYGDELVRLGESTRGAAMAAEIAAKALTQAQLHSHAAAVRAELHDGDVCPVCGGEYRGGNTLGDADVEKCKAESDRANKELETATAKENECVKHLDRVKSDYSRESGECKDLTDAVAAVEAEIASTRVDPKIYEKLFELLDVAKLAAEKAQRSGDATVQCRPRIAVLRAELDAAEAALREAEQKAADQRAALGDDCGKTDGRLAQMREAIAAEEKAAAEIDEKRKALTGEVQASEAAMAAVERSLDAAKKDCPIDMPPFDEEAYGQAKEAMDRINKHIAQNETEIAVKDVEVKALGENYDKLVKLNAEKSEYLKSADRYKVIADMTKGKAMLNYVAEEYIAEFTSVASKILNELSDGKYTMKYERTDGFVVIDFLNDEKSRKTDTLSGGELFLASLSVAIAIARTQSRGNNAFFFLDEGFGTLDDELIDTVYGALEMLSEDCLVGVISHASALIDKMPSCVEVIAATDTTGSIIKY